MEGRMEIDAKYFAKTEKKLETLPSYVTGWYHAMQASYLSAKTCRDYVFKIAKFLTSISEDPKQVKPDQITEDAVNSYMFSKRTKLMNGKVIETSDSHKNSVWYALKSFLEYMKKHNYIDNNYILDIKKKKNHDLDRINKHRVRLTIDDFNKLLSYVDQKHSRYPERDRAILLLFMTTGMRKAALSSIDIQDIDFSNNILTIVDKGSFTHEYNLNDKVLQALNNWISKRKSFKKSEETSALFISNLGNRISESELERMIKRYTSEALSVCVSPHKLRSGFITIMYDQTGDIEKVRRMVGHKNIATTQRYIVTEGEEKAEAADIMQSLLA